MALPADSGVSETRPPRRGLLQILWKDVLLLGAGNVGYAVGQLVFRSILIVTLVPAEYGRLTLLLSIYNTVWLVATGGLPDGVARHLAIARPEQDAATTHAVFKATLWPTAIGALAMGGISAVMLDSVWAGFVGAIGLASLVYASVTIGILRGRLRIGAASSVMPVTALGEALPLAALVMLGLGVTTLSAFSAFCLGNVVGLAVGLALVIKTKPAVEAEQERPGSIITPRQLLGFSFWLAIAATGMALLPLAARLAASLDSYLEVAIVDIALVVFAVPQRLGALMVAAMAPHASRSIHFKGAAHRISRREQLLTVAPFLIAAAVLAFTPLVSTVADAIGRPEYSRCGTYLSLVMLAGPARVLYGVAAGILIGHADAKFLALTVTAVTICAATLMFAAAALGEVTVAFAVLIPAFWAIYLILLYRLDHLDARLAARAST